MMTLEERGEDELHLSDHYGTDMTINAGKVLLSRHPEIGEDDVVVFYGLSESGQIEQDVYLMTAENVFGRVRE